jgi:hypothetical protein
MSRRGNKQLPARKEREMQMAVNGTSKGQKIGGIAALYLAAAYLAAIPYFLLIAKIPDAASPAEKLSALAASRTGQYAMTLVVYVIFGLVLVVLAAALHERARQGADGLMRVATPIAFIWAGLLIASGMIFNVGMLGSLALLPGDPAQAAALWSPIDLISAGLSGNGEIVGGCWMLLVSVAALKTKCLPVASGVLGIVVAALGIAAVVPALKDLAQVFGLGQIVWFAWIGFVLLRGGKGAKA